MGFRGWIGFSDTWMGRGLYGFAKAKTRIDADFFLKTHPPIYKVRLFLSEQIKHKADSIKQNTDNHRIPPQIASPI
jgi:hypothetical protein